MLFVRSSSAAAALVCLVFPPLSDSAPLEAGGAKTVSLSVPAPGADVAKAALSGDEASLQALRAAGPGGLETLLEAASKQVEALRRNESRLEDPANADLRRAIDSVAGQRDAYASGLYWFTDLEAAKAEARKTAKPILSLRLLGNLNEEYSCANSRFFRTMLYANTEVSKVLREKYVLHWKSVRPAPLLTIDMGDGRRIKRTITGNSIHYILDPEGNVLDALPGIYSPQGFLAALRRIRSAAWPYSELQDELSGLLSGTPSLSRRLSGLKTLTETDKELRDWHGRESHNLCMEWLGAAISAGAYDAELTTSSAPLEEKVRLIKARAFPHSSGLSAAEEAHKEDLPLAEWQTLRFVRSLNSEKEAEPKASPVGAVTTSPSAVDGNTPALPDSSARKVERIREFPYPTDFDPPKGMVERPILQKSLPETAAVPAQDPASPVAVSSGPALAERMTPRLWSQIAEPLRSSVALDESSRRLMMQKLPAEILRASEMKEGSPDSRQSLFGRQLERFEQAITRDMARNEYYYHNRIHQWLEEDKDGSLHRDVEALNHRVYAELFLTPDHDAWLGLVPDDTYTALEKDGCACDKNAPPMRRPAKP